MKTNSILTHDFTVTVFEGQSPLLQQTITVPAGTSVLWMEHEKRWVIADTDLICRLTNNNHDPRYRWIGVPSEMVGEKIVGSDFIAGLKSSMSEATNRLKFNPNEAKRAAAEDALNEIREVIGSYHEDSGGPFNTAECFNIIALVAGLFVCSQTNGVESIPTVRNTLVSLIDNVIVAEVVQKLMDKK